MAKDIVPELNEAIQLSFQNNVIKDRRIAQISKRIRDGTATFVDGHDYAERLGENLSKALVDNLTADTLPEGRLYYNIATRTVTPALKVNYDLTNEAAADIQRTLDAATGITINPVAAEFPTERINGLIDKMTGDNNYIDDVLRWLVEPIINNSEAFMDDYIDANASNRYQMGLSAKITRSVQYKCCDWCQAMAGTYDYDNKPDDIFRRHEYCRCAVTYQTDKVSQNVWSKRTWASSPEEIKRQVGTTPTMTASERTEAFNRVYRDTITAEQTRQLKELSEELTRAAPSEVAEVTEKIKLAKKKYNKLTPEQRVELFNQSQRRTRG